ncbi:CLUMA_CG001044, isoform A [Clunio marinus]|uniref:CLUMA_CG001044, isoform A n=1 Tax=Clunio marinus TaxID=568069 RepID=A0A1J1HI72_9DIPT|nr:CLUMA_CG001044, isoform A [Clunio marinus]
MTLDFTISHKNNERKRKNAKKREICFSLRFTTTRMKNGATWEHLATCREHQGSVKFSSVESISKSNRLNNDEDPLIHEKERK